MEVPLAEFASKVISFLFYGKVVPELFIKSLANLSKSTTVLTLRVFELLKWLSSKVCPKKI